MIFSENRLPPRIKPGQAFSGSCSVTFTLLRRHKGYRGAGRERRPRASIEARAPSEHVAAAGAWRNPDAPVITDMANRSRDACAPEFCRYDAQKPELDPVMRRRWWIPAAISITFSQIKQDGGTPKDAYSFRPHPSGCGRDPSGGRSPVGVPPRHLRQRTNATAQLQKRSSWDAAKKRALPAPSCPSPAAWPKTGHSAGRTSSRSRPGPIRKMSYLRNLVFCL